MTGSSDGRSVLSHPIGCLSEGDSGASSSGSLDEDGLSRCLEGDIAGEGGGQIAFS